MKSVIAQNIHHLQSQLGKTRLIVVTKRRSLEEIRVVLDAGVKDIGENQLQEIQRKFAPKVLIELKTRGVKLHYLGNLQKNKIKEIVRYCDVIQSVDSLSKAERVQKAAEERGKKMSIFIQLNIAKEAQKGGLIPDANQNNLVEMLRAVREMKSIELKGFMCMGVMDDERQTRAVFRSCKSLSDAYHLGETSMGMSGDDKVALEEGSTMLRIGTKIFQSD